MRLSSKLKSGTRTPSSSCNAWTPSAKAAPNSISTDCDWWWVVSKQLFPTTQIKVAVFLFRSCNPPETIDQDGLLYPFLTVSIRKILTYFFPWGFSKRGLACQTILIASKCQEPTRTTAEATSARAACTALQSLAMACFSKIIQCLGNPFFLSNFPNESSPSQQLSNGMRSMQWRELYNWDQLGHIHAELHKSLELVPGRVKKEEDTGRKWNWTTSFSTLERSNIKSHLNVVSYSTKHIFQVRLAYSSVSARCLLVWISKVYLWHRVISCFLARLCSPSYTLQALSWKTLLRSSAVAPARLQPSYSSWAVLS